MIRNMNSPKPLRISNEEYRISKFLLGLTSKKLLTAVHFGANASVYNPNVTVAELTTAQSIILALFYALLNSDLKFCLFLQGLISKVEQLKSPYLPLWLRDDFKFNTSDVLKVISNLAHLVRGQKIALPDYVLRIFVSLNSKYGVIDTCKTNKDLETFYFLLSVNVPCSRSQQTDSTSVSNLISAFETNIGYEKNLLGITPRPVPTTTNKPGNLPSLFSNIPPNFFSLNSPTKQLDTRGNHDGQAANSLFKEPNKDSHAGSNSYQRGRSSSISNQSISSEPSTYTDSSRSEVKPRHTARSRNKSRTRGPRPKEDTHDMPKGKPLGHAISTPNILEPLLKDDEICPEAALVQSYLSKIGTAPVSFPQIRRLVCRREGRGGKSPLHHAAKDGLLAVVKGLIKFGAPVDSRDDVGFTPAHYAATGAHIEILEVLKQHKADLTAVGDSGDTLLHLAARKNNAGTCGWLLENGVNLDAQGFKGRTALHCAAMWGCVNTVRLLLTQGASVEIKDFYKNTAYDLAVSQGHPEVANMLRNAMKI